MIRICLLRLLVCVAIAPWYLAGARATAAQAPEVDVILWFDTEDYISPSDDDSDKRLAELLSERHIRATFKVVGEKARVLERHGRNDVIAALKQHCIGFHANFHSVHPAPAEYLADCGLLDGIEEFVRREGPGAADVRRIFSVPTLACYGQPGSSWAAQAIAAMPRCGIGTDGVPCYVDSGNHVGLGGVPFWYAGALVVYDMHPNETRMDLFAPAGLEKGEKDFSEIADRLAKNGGGLISIYYHPCEWVTSQFWDAPNFSRGMNTPRDQWKLPKQRTSQEADQAFGRFAAYVDFMRKTPGVRFVTACDLSRLYPDRLVTRGATPDEVLEVARRIRQPDFEGLDDQKVGQIVFSPADQFQVLTLALARAIEQPKVDASRPIALERLLGPDSPPPPESTDSKSNSVAGWDFRRAVLDARDFLRANHRIPSRIFFGAEAVSPADFVVCLAEAYVRLRDQGAIPERVDRGCNVEVLTAGHVVQDSAKVFGGWIIHRADFRAPRILDVARLQAWTLKPAMRMDPADVESGAAH